MARQETKAELQAQRNQLLERNVDLERKLRSTEYRIKELEHERDDARRYNNDLVGEMRERDDDLRSIEQVLDATMVPKALVVQCYEVYPHHVQTSADRPSTKELTLLQRLVTYTNRKGFF